MLSLVKMPLKGEVVGHALNIYGKYIVDHGNSWENHGIVFLNFCGKPELCSLANSKDPDFVLNMSFHQAKTITNLQIKK